MPTELDFVLSRSELKCVIRLCKHTHTRTHRIAQRQGNSSLLLHDLVMHSKIRESEDSQDEWTGKASCWSLVWCCIAAQASRVDDQPMVKSKESVFRFRSKKWESVLHVQRSERGEGDGCCDSS